MSLKSYRKINNMTQKQLADKVGVVEETISRYEKGKRIPDINTAAKIGKILDIPDAELLRMFGEASA